MHAIASKHIEVKEGIACTSSTRDSDLSFSAMKSWKRQHTRTEYLLLLARCWDIISSVK